MSLLQSNPPKYERTLDDYKIVSRGYRMFKRYVRKNRKGGISVNQFNREGIAASKADKEIDATMGAGGIEAYRSTDVNILYGGNGRSKPTPDFFAKITVI